MAARTRYLAIIGAAAMLFIFSGCTGGSLSYRDTPLAAAWGQSFQAERYNQTLHPEAAQHPAGVEGLDGPAAANVLQNYRGGFEKAVPRPVYNIGIGNFAGM